MEKQTPSWTKNKIVLGTTSIWRKDLCSSLLGYLPETISFFDPDIDEKAIRDPNPRHMVQMIAVGKLMKILADAPELRNSIIICCDQVVVYKHGQIREKPKDETQAREFLKTYNSFPPTTTTGVCVYNPVSKIATVASDYCCLPIDPKKPLLDKGIDAILSRGYAQICCGALTIEDPLFRYHCLLDKSVGGYDGLQGFPARLVLSCLRISQSVLNSIPKFISQGSCSFNTHPSVAADITRKVLLSQINSSPLKDGFSIVSFNDLAQMFLISKPVFWAQNIVIVYAGKKSDVLNALSKVFNDLKLTFPFFYQLFSYSAFLASIGLKGDDESHNSSKSSLTPIDATTSSDQRSLLVTDVFPNASKLLFLYPKSPLKEYQGFKDYGSFQNIAYDVEI